MLGLPARHRECYRRHERRCFGLVLGLQLSAVRFYDSTHTVQTKAIMSLSDAAEWFPPPILRIRRESRFWFVKAEQKPPIADSGFCNENARAAVVLKGVSKKLHKHLLEKLRINSQRPVRKLHVPCDLVVFF